MAGCTSHDSVPSNIRPYNIGKRLDQWPENESIEYIVSFSNTKVQYFEMVVPFISLICLLSVSVLVQRGAYEEKYNRGTVMTSPN